MAIASRIVHRSSENDVWRTDEQELRHDSLVVPEALLTTPVEEDFRPVPEQLIERYATVALRRAATQQLEGGDWYAEVPSLEGVYGEGDSEEDALTSLAESIRSWAIFKMERRHGNIPVLEEIDLNRG